MGNCQFTNCRQSNGVNKSHVSTATVQRAGTPSKRKVSPTQTHLEEPAMNKILTAALIKIVLIAAALCSTSAFAEDKFHVSMENGKQRIDFSLNGNAKCAIVDDKITCQPMPQAPVQVASSESN
jgi:hypothetical protein